MSAFFYAEKFSCDHSILAAKQTGQGAALQCDRGQHLNRYFTHSTSPTVHVETPLEAVGTAVHRMIIC